MTESTVIIRRPPIGPMGRIIRIVILVVTVALVIASSVNAAMGQRDISILYALAAPLGVASWSFARADHHQTAVILLSGVLIAVLTLTLILSPLGVHDHAVLGFVSVILLDSLLLSRRAFIPMAALAIGAGSFAFGMVHFGRSNSRIEASWLALFDFLLICTVSGVLGRVVAEILFGSLGDAQQTAIKDRVTGLANRSRFLMQAASKLRGADEDDGFGVLALADLDQFRRVNHVVGHAAADRILAEASRRVESLSPGAIVARMGDDEFGVFTWGLADESKARELAQRLHTALTFEHAGVTVRAAVGYVAIAPGARGIDALMMAADSALAQAKARDSDRLVGT